MSIRSDHVIDNGVVFASIGKFSNAVDLVIVTQNIKGDITATKAATVIGSASSAFVVDDIRLFAVDKGTDTALYLFKSAGADALVSADELTLIGTLQGAASTALADYGFA